MNKENLYRATLLLTEIRQARQRLMPTRDLLEYCLKYSHEHPEVVALWCFGIGFLLGWKL